MKPRTIKELLQIMRDNFDKYFDGQMTDGLCLLAIDLSVSELITNEEEDILRKYIVDNPPKKPFYGAYHWKEGEIRPRKLWLTKHIKLLSEKPKS